MIEKREFIFFQHIHEIGPGYESKTIRLGPHNMLAIIVALAVAAHYFL